MLCARSLSPTLLGLNPIINQVQNTFKVRPNYQQSPNTFPSLDSWGSTTPTQWIHLECKQNPKCSKLGSIKKVMKKIAHSLQGPRLMHKWEDYWEVSCRLSNPPFKHISVLIVVGPTFTDMWIADYSWNKEKMAWTKLLKGAQESRCDHYRWMENRHK